jgi:ornithine carbamoyltransferase
MTTITETRNLLRIADLSPDELEALLDLAVAMRDDPFGWRDALAGRMLACCFTKPSTRTRVSFEAAAWRLGMLPVMLRPDELQLGRGEPLEDTARALSSYAAALAVRTFAQRDVEALAHAASVPVINALTDTHHPCQALADVLTLRDRFGPLDGLRIAYVGDGNNVAHSLIEAASLLGMEIAVASPPGFEPDAEIVRAAQAAARERAGRVQINHDPRLAVKGAHAVYTDVWVSMGHDGEQAERLAALERYRVDERLMGFAAADAVFLHCLPAHRGDEVAAAVIDGAASAVWEQAANRLSTEQAVLYALVTGRLDSRTATRVVAGAGPEEHLRVSRSGVGVLTR